MPDDPQPDLLNIDCPGCNGDGIIGLDICPMCDGFGWVAAPRANAECPGPRRE